MQKEIKERERKKKKSAVILGRVAMCDRLDYESDVVYVAVLPSSTAFVLRSSILPPWLLKTSPLKVLTFQVEGGA